MVSAVDGPRRSWQGGEIEGVIYADVTLYPGFSGGPLVDLNGHVVGLNSSRLTRHNSSAIPVATLQRVARPFRRMAMCGAATWALGASRRTCRQVWPRRMARPSPTALLVITVESGSPAEQAGLLLGDLIVSMNGQTTADADTRGHSWVRTKSARPYPLRSCAEASPETCQSPSASANNIDILTITGFVV